MGTHRYAAVLAAALGLVGLTGSGVAEARVTPAGCFALETGTLIHRAIMDPGAHSLCLETAEGDDSCLYRLQLANQNLVSRGCRENTSGETYRCVFGLTLAYEYAVFYNCSPDPGAAPPAG